jgi:hypothetical protein
VIPLLLCDPKSHPTIQNYKGLPFDDPTQFERYLSTLVSVITQSNLTSVGFADMEQALAADLSKLQQESALAHDIVSKYIGNVDAELFFQSIPSYADPDWHAVDFALYLATRMNAARLHNLSLQVLTYVFWNSGLGTTSLADHWGASSEARRRILVRSSAVTNSNYYVWDRVLELLESWADPDFIALHTALSVNKSRLSEVQAERLWAFVQTKLPNPDEYRRDVVWELARYSILYPRCLTKVREWLDSGYWDGRLGPQGSLSPSAYFEISYEMTALGAKGITEGNLLEDGLSRMRRLLRSCDRKLVAIGAQWMLHTTQLHSEDRPIAHAEAKRGINGAEWNGWEDGRQVRSYLWDIFAAVEKGEVSHEGIEQINNVLLQWGLEASLTPLP